MQFLKRLLPKGSGPKGFESVARTQAEKPDTDYLNDLVEHRESGIVQSFTAQFDDGRQQKINAFGKFSRKKRLDELKLEIHDVVETGAAFKLFKDVERSEGARPVSIRIASFAGGQRVFASTAPDNHEIPDQSLQAHPGSALD
jgi:hypothetical protein